MKTVAFLFLVIAITGGLFAAGSADGESSEITELVIPHYRAGQNVGGKFFLPQVERFNTTHEDRYRIVIEEVPQDAYQDRIKLLAQQNRLPALIEGTVDTMWFENVMLKNSRVHDLKPWLDANPGIAETLIEDGIDYNTKNGSIVSLPLAVVRPVGLFYNESLINPQKSIADMNHQEFSTILGDQTIAFMTIENAWTTNLFYTSLIAAEPGGIALLQNGVSEKVYDFSGPVWLNATKNLQDFLQNQAASNTLGAAYADAANAFMSRNAAVIPNGPWMVNDFAAGSEDKWSGGFTGEQVRADIYPGNFAIANARIYNWWIPAGLPENEVEAAQAFLAFMMRPDELEAFMLAEGGVAPRLQLSNAFLEQRKENPLLADLAAAVDENTRFAPAFVDVVPGSIANTEWGKLIPKLTDGSFTPEEFLAELTLKAEETRF